MSDVQPLHDYKQEFSDAMLIARLAHCGAEICSMTPEKLISIAMTSADGTPCNGLFVLDIVIETLCQISFLSHEYLKRERP